MGVVAGVAAGVGCGVEVGVGWGGGLVEVVFCDFSVCNWQL